METLPITYVIPKVEYDSPTESNQTFRLEIREKGDANYTVVTNGFVADQNGYCLNPVHIEGLKDDTEYEYRLTNLLETTKVFTSSFYTSINFSLGDSPLYLKKIYPGQTLDLFTHGLLASSLPVNYKSFYFILESHYRDAFEGFSNMIPVGGMRWEKVGGENRLFRGASLNEGRYLIANNEELNPDRKINSETMFGERGDRNVSIIFWFLTKDLRNKVLLQTGDTENRLTAKIADNKVVIDMVRDGNLYSCESRYDIDINDWYCLELSFNATDPTKHHFMLNGGTQNISFPDSANIKGLMKGSPYHEVYLGYNDLTSTPSNGLVVRRWYYARLDGAELDVDSRNRMVNPEDYLPAVTFKNSKTDEQFVNSSDWILKLDNAQMSVTIDPALPLDKFDFMFIKTPVSARDEHYIEVLEFDRLLTPFDIDFTDDFDQAIVDFKKTFYSFHSQWGGANGGVNGHLIYANREKRAVIFETHGDLYDGTVQGVHKAAQNSTNTGYGYPMIHEIPADPKYGKPWVTRVGAVAVSADYCGYGEWSTWLKVPKGTYGVSPALWFFHYQEYYETDPRWAEWIEKGGIPYGGSDPYMVINMEIDMELPSHLIQGSFATWDELGLAYFDPDALDTQYRVGIENSTGSQKAGLYRLKDPTRPNQYASWEYEADTWNVVSQPHYTNCKFNNWVGEKSSGNGWSYEEADYSGEEYLALMTKLDRDFADDEFHKWTMKWFADRTELWIDDVLIRTNRGFVPYIPGRLTFGGWFPSAVAGSSTTPWIYSPERAWAGYPADFGVLQLEIQRIQYIPYSDEEAGGTMELWPETYPEAGLREFITN